MACARRKRSGVPNAARGMDATQFQHRGKDLLTFGTPIVPMMPQTRCMKGFVRPAAGLIENHPMTASNRIRLRALLTAGIFSAASVLAAPALGQQFPKVPASKVPVPTPSPRGASEPVAFFAAPQTDPIVEVINRSTAVAQPAQSGALKDGLDALTGKNIGRTLSIISSMPTGSLERKVLLWATALSGQSGLSSAQLSAIPAQLPDWPGQDAMQRNFEAALASEKHSPAEIIAAFGKSRPDSLNGAVALAQAHLSKGDRKSAHAVISPFWREERLSAEDEKFVLDRVSKALSQDDHRARMHMQFYHDRASDGMRMAKLSGQASLAKAWEAVIRNSDKAEQLLAAVDLSSRKDPGYLFARIKQARRSGDLKEAARLMLSAPRARADLGEPDEWWVERRLVSRAILDAGDAKTAYRIAAAHSAESPAEQAEAEFHAGWYALRYLKDSRSAAKHFANILKVSSTPISQSRAHYWLGRSTSGATALSHFRAAAQFGGTFYGQLAAQKTGAGALQISNPRPSAAERIRFATREQVRAIDLLESAGYEWRADALYRDLARSLNSPGELALLAARAEKRGNATLALQIGKIAHGRGLEVDTVSWPIGAIPGSARIGDTGRALAYAIARQESAFNVAAVSPANARGLLQLLPGTAKSMARKTGSAYSLKKLTTDAAYNATLGAAYLSEQLDNFNNSYILTFVGYNAGPGRVRQWIETYGDPRGRSIEDVVDWVERIPFTETRNYVQRVMENYQVYKARLAAGRLDIEGDLRFGRR